jgi:cyclophilin family peptidyl-prolyl cis-trans isomerase
MMLSSRVCGVVVGAVCSVAAFSPAFAAKKPAKDAKAAPVATPATAQPGTAKIINVAMVTSMGVIKLELDPEKAPVSVKNFVSYVESGSYNKTVFHRVIDGFMIQGGGFDEKMNEKKTRSPIKNEAANGLKNERGTLAMARTNEPDSATAQFFVNLVDNRFLDHIPNDPSRFGYAVFGKVVQGMEVVDAIAKVKTGQFSMYSDVPVKPVVIESVKVEK